MPNRVKGPPRWATRLNAVLLRLGLRIGTQYLLTVPGRVTGRLHSTPVSVVLVGGQRYIVAGLGDVNWAKNVRAAGWAILLRGRQRQRVRLSELPVHERAPILSQFLEQVPGAARFFAVRSDPAGLAEAAARCPVFRVHHSSELDPSVL
jgi:hypothetical protein